MAHNCDPNYSRL